MWVVTITVPPIASHIIRSIVVGTYLKGWAVVALCLTLPTMASAQVAQAPSQIDVRDALVRSVTNNHEGQSRVLDARRPVISSTPELSEDEAELFAALGSRFTDDASA